MKDKGEMETYTQLNAEFQKIARRDKKAFLNKQCKEVERNNKMRKTRNLLKKIRGIKGTFSSRMDAVNDRNGKDLTEAEENKKRWQGYTEDFLMTQITMMVWSMGLRKHYYEQS